LVRFYLWVMRHPVWVGLVAGLLAFAAKVAQSRNPVAIAINTLLMMAAGYFYARSFRPKHRGTAPTDRTATS
jgi:hypothetical protein